MAGKRKKSFGPQTPWEALSLASGLGIHIASVVVVCGYGGRKLDEWLGSWPWGVILGISGGFVIGIWSSYKKILGK